MVKQLNGPVAFPASFNNNDGRTAQFGHLDAGAVLRMKKMLRDHHPDSTSQNMKEILGVIAAFEVSLSYACLRQYLSSTSPVCHKRNSKLWQQSCKSSFVMPVLDIAIYYPCGLNILFHKKPSANHNEHAIRQTSAKTYQKATLLFPEATKHRVRPELGRRTSLPAFSSAWSTVIEQFEIPENPFA